MHKSIQMSKIRMGISSGGDRLRTVHASLPLPQLLLLPFRGLQSLVHRSQLLLQLLVLLRQLQHVACPLGHPLGSAAATNQS